MIQKIFILSTLLLSVSLSTLQAAKSEDLIKTIKTDYFSLDDRLQALKELQSQKDTTATPALVEMLKNPKDSIVMRAHVVEYLTKCQDPWAIIELKKLVQDSSVNLESRNLALHGLWQKDLKGMIPELINIAQSSRNPVELRVEALTLLRTSGDQKFPPKFWKNLTQKNNPAQVRIAAWNAMEQLGMLEQEKISFFESINNLGEPDALRKAMILNAERFFLAEEVEPELVKIVSKPENSLEMRRFALDHLFNYGNPNLPQQLQELLSSEKNSVLRGDLKRFIEILTPQK